MRSLFVPELLINEYSLTSECGHYKIHPIKMVEGYGLPVRLLNDSNYTFAWSLLLKLEIKDMNPLKEELWLGI